MEVTTSNPKMSLIKNENALPKLKRIGNDINYEILPWLITPSEPTSSAMMPQLKIKAWLFRKITLLITFGDVPPDKWQI